MAFWQVPAAVLAFLAWLQAPAVSLADASHKEALRRQFLPKSSRSLTNQDLPPPRTELPAATAAAEPPDTPPGAAAANPPGEPPAEKDKIEKHDEAWWRDRMTAARDAVSRDEGLVEAMQSRVNALTTDWTNRDDPAQKAILFDQRQRALSELDRLNKQVVADRKAIDGIVDEARRQGVPPGWIR